jgi:hypothetical protein
MADSSRVRKALEGKITTTHLRVTALSKTYQGHKVEKRIQLIYLQSIVQHPTHRESQIHVEQKKHGGVSETPRG